MFGSFPMEVLVYSILILHTETTQNVLLVSLFSKVDSWTTPQPHIWLPFRMQPLQTPEALPSSPELSHTSSTPTSCVELYERLQRWRYRQRIQWPGLFQSLTTSHSSEAPPTNLPAEACIESLPTISFKLSAAIHQDHKVRIYLNNIIICICDGCGALLPLKPVLSSSASTVSPPKKLVCGLASTSSDEVQDVNFVRCDQCAFTTPLGTLRRMLRLPPCGPSFPPTEAFALLTEALGAPTVLQTMPAAYRPWFLNPTCRMQGQDALLSLLGLRDECLIISDDPLPRIRSSSHYALRAERVLNAHFNSRPEFPYIPFSIASLIPDSSNDKSLHSSVDDSTQHVAALVSEAQRLCKTVTASDTNRNNVAASLFRIKNISIEYEQEQVKVRLHNHIVRPTSFEAL